MSNFDRLESWDLSPAKSHPNAVALLTDEFYWSSADDGSPLGNDTGSDAFASFRAWRKHNLSANASDYLNQLFDDLQVTPESWNITETDDVESLWEQDETVIALAFGQLLVEGQVDEAIKQTALLAIERQSLPFMVENWEGFEDERVERLGKMKAVLEKI